MVVSWVSARSACIACLSVLPPPHSLTLLPSLLPLPQSINYDTNLKALVASGRFTPTSNHTFITVDPKTGDYEKHGVIGDIDVLDGASAYSSACQKLYLTLAVNTSGVISFDIFGIELEGGARTKVAVDAGHFIGTLTPDGAGEKL